MATRVTDGARRERHEKRGCRPRFARLAASPLPRACIALRTKSEEKERLLAVYPQAGTHNFLVRRNCHEKKKNEY